MFGDFKVKRIQRGTISSVKMSNACRWPGDCVLNRKEPANSIPG